MNHLIDPLVAAARRGDSTAIVRGLRELAARHPETWTEALRELPAAPDPAGAFVMAHVALSKGTTGIAVEFKAPKS